MMLARTDTVCPDDARDAGTIRRNRPSALVSTPRFIDSMKTLAASMLLPSDAGHMPGQEGRLLRGGWRPPERARHRRGDGCGQEEPAGKR